MKYFLYLLLSLFFVVSSCERIGKNVVLIGTVEGGINDGDTIYLMSSDKNNISRVVAKTVVADGTFELLGNTPLPAVCTAVTLAPDGRIARKMVFIAEGDEVAMTVLPEYYRIAGSPLNDVLQKCRDSLEVASRLYMRYYTKKAETPSLSVKGVKEADDVMTIASYQYRKVLYNAIESNTGNILGAYFIKEHMDKIEPAQGVRFIKAMPQEYRDNTIVYINKLFAAKEKTALGARFVDFSMIDTEGKQHALSDYAGKGKPVLVSVWMSGEKSSVDAQKKLCALCGEVELVSVSADRNYDVWRSTVMDNAMCGVQLTDLKGWNSAFLSLYGIDKIPYYLLVDATGIISYRGTSFNAVSKLLK